MQNLQITLKVVDAAYNPQDEHTDHKIIACMNTVEVVTIKEIKPLVANPCVVSALLELHNISMWCDLFMTDQNFKLLHNKKWSNEVNCNCGILFILSDELLDHH
jgi:hypothetical protein